MIEMLRGIAILFLIYFQSSFGSALNSKWHYQCTEGFCVKTLITPDTTSPQSLAECNLLCLDAAGVWPKPSDFIYVKNLTEIDIGKFSFSTTQNTSISSSVSAAFDIFTYEVRKLLPCRSWLKLKNATLTSVVVDFQIGDQDTSKLTLTTSESYIVQSYQTIENVLSITVTAQTFFGARNALETLSQLVVYDDLRDRVLFPTDVSISDGPAFSWRGISLDTARNFVTPKAIKRTLRAMAASKLNTFHWHLTDTASFPYVSKSHPELSEYGAYSPSKVYTDDTVRGIVEYARLRGIRVVPELDAPAHVGEGWQDSGVTTCFNWKPWSSYCVEPPCGQFDPSRPELYDILEDLYGDLLEQFGTEVFHMGGDEVNINCWNNTENLTKWIVNEKGWTLDTLDFYSKVWPYFQSEAAKRLYNKAGKELPIILWNSDLTALENVADILPPSKYIIQVWSGATEEPLEELLSKNYSVILSNYDALYLDCGFAGWVTDGNNWCSPYKGWQLVYENKPIDLAGDRVSQVLGGEVALWTEEAGTSALDTRLWPRSAAFAETLWTAPITSWTEAEERMLIHRERLVRLGIQAEELQPEWCLRNHQSCSTTGKFNGN